DWASTAVVKEALNRLAQDSNPAVREAVFSQHTDGVARLRHDPYQLVGDEFARSAMTDQFRTVRLRNGLDVTFASDGNPTDLVADRIVRAGVYGDEPVTNVALDLFKAD